MASRQAVRASSRRKVGRPPLHENQRERVIAQAAELFAREGFESASLSQLARELGISKAAIYHYFPTKQEILDEIVFTTLDGLSEFVNGELEGVESPRERLITFMTAHASFFEENYWAFTAMLVDFSEIVSPATRVEAVDRRDGYEAVLRQILADGIESGDFGPVDVPVTGRAVLSMLNWMARWFKPSGSVRASEFASAYAELLLGGLGAASEA